MSTWLEKCGLSLQKVERCMELVFIMERSSGIERKLVEARLLGFLEGLGFGWRRGIVGAPHVCEIINIPWKFVEGGVVWGNEALASHDPRRVYIEKCNNLCETDIDLAAVLRDVADNEVIDHDLVMKLKKERKERENQTRKAFQ
jgi:hypothetical protein